MNIINWLKEQWNTFIGKSSPQDYLYEITPADLKQQVDAFLSSTEGHKWAEYVISDDPALSNLPEEDAISQLIQYQGLHAVVMHKKAHALYVDGNITEARALSQAARRATGGIEVHPGATIGKNFFIDHGTGVVIGETAELGDNVMLYHRVTLGNDGSGQTVTREDGTERRHPKVGNKVTLSTGAEVLGAATLGDGVVMGSGARVIGAVQIGKNVSIAPGVLVRQDVPENLKVLSNDGLGLKVKNTDGEEYFLPNRHHGEPEAFAERVKRQRDQNGRT